MPRPRKAQVSLSDTLYYHCIARCVRRAYLCGEYAASEHTMAVLLSPASSLVSDTQWEMFGLHSMQ